MDSANGRPARSEPFGPGRIAERMGIGIGSGARHDHRRLRPSVAGLEGRQLLSGPTTATIASFNGTQQAIVRGLVMDGQGNLYGTTAASGEGGGKGDGTVFEIPQGTTKVITLASFDGRKGQGLGALSIDAQGNLYGSIAQEGGVNDDGTVFEIPHGTNKVVTLASFDGDDGEFPGGVTVDAQGNLYGTASDGWIGGATAFEVARGSNAVTTIAQFSSPGAAPKGLVMDAQGNLYGTDQNGGARGTATVFEIAHGSNTVTTLATFGGLLGSGVSGVTADAQGNLYGTTEDGGTFGDGSVFEIAHGSNAVTTLASFNGLVGTVPDATVGVKLDAQGNLHGVTAYGGSINGVASNDGTLFEVAQGSGKVTTLASFTNISGALASGLLMDGQGNFYGTTDGGGHAGGGSVFEVAMNPQPAATAIAPGSPTAASAPAPTSTVTTKTITVVTVPTGKHGGKSAAVPRVKKTVVHYKSFKI